MNKEKQLILKENFPLTFARMYEMPKTVRLSFKQFYQRTSYTQNRLGKGKVRSFVVTVRKYLYNSIFNRKALRVLERPFHCIEAWGISCGDGWYEIIYELASKLEPLIAKQDPENRFDYAAVQVKEKFGGLRFYTHGETEEMSVVLREAENASYNVCEWCGEPADHEEERNYGWILTLCSACKEKRRKEREG